MKHIIVRMTEIHTFDVLKYNFKAWVDGPVKEEKN